MANRSRPKSNPRQTAPSKMAKPAPMNKTAPAEARTRTRMSVGKSIRSSSPSAFAFKSARNFFEAASTSPRITPSVDVGPNGYHGEIEKVRTRSRWMYANDSFYRQACRQVANNTVHYGIKPIIKDKKLLKLWKRWVKESDARGRLDFYGIQWMLAMVVARDGEAIVRFRERREGDMVSKVNFQLQLLEADHMPLHETKMAENGNWIVAGVERDSIERPTAYWLYDHHPKDWQGTGKHSMLPKRVPANDVSHIYMPERLSDTRGYPWGASGLNTADGLRTYDDLEIARKNTQTGPAGVYKKPRLSTDERDFETEIDENGNEFHAVEAGTMVVVPEDWDVEFMAPVATDANYGVFRREGLSGLAVAMGLAVEHISLNFEKLNDRTYRAVMLEVTRYLESIQHHMMVKQLCDPTIRRFVSDVVLNGQWSIPEGQDFEDVIDDIEWMAPARGHIHPLQEIEAFAKAVENGFTSRKRVAAQFGEDVEDIDAENSEDQTRAQLLKLLYPIYAKLAAEAEVQASKVLNEDEDPEFLEAAE